MRFLVVTCDSQSSHAIPSRHTMRFPVVTCHVDLPTFGHTPLSFLCEVLPPFLPGRDGEHGRGANSRGAERAAGAPRLENAKARRQQRWAVTNTK